MKKDEIIAVLKKDYGKTDADLDGLKFNELRSLLKQEKEKKDSGCLN